MFGIALVICNTILAIFLFGGAGYVADYGIERFYRDVRLFRIYEGTTQIQQIVIAREMQRNFES